MPVQRPETAALLDVFARRSKSWWDRPLCLSVSGQRRPLHRKILIAAELLQVETEKKESRLDRVIIDGLV